MSQLPLGGWAFARLLPPYTGEASKNYARSLRRRFAGIGLILVLGIVAFLWTWTANLIVCGAAFSFALVGLWLYAEHGHRQAAYSKPPPDPLEDGTYDAIV